MKGLMVGLALIFVLPLFFFYGCEQGDGADDDDDDDGVDDDVADDDSSDYSGDERYTLHDPRERGPFAVGNRTFIFVDPDRWDPATDSARKLMVEVWYPASREAEDMPYDILKNFCPVWWESYVRPTLESEYGVLPEELDNFDKPTGSHRDAPVDYNSAPYPILVFSHGNGGLRIQNLTMCEWLASFGFVVLAPDHTGNSLITCLPEGVVIFDPLLVPTSFWQRKDDISFLIDKMTEVGAYDPDGFFTGLVDAEKVGTFGHSFGGTVAAEVAKSDTRIRAAIDMASFSFPWYPYDFSASVMFMIALEDDTMYEAMPIMRYAYNIFPTPKFKLELINAGHYTFSDACILVPSLMGDGDGCGIGERHETGEQFEFIEHDLAMQLISSYAVSFFGYILEGRSFFADYLGENHYPSEMDYDFKF